MPETEDPTQPNGPAQGTAADETAGKVQVEPYHAATKGDVEAGVIGCVFCANVKFRRSRVRIHDLRELLLLRYPMRCMRCNQRQYGYFLTAALASPPRSQTARVSRGEETWKAWTESEKNGHSMQRPMTTSIGSRATKLQRPPTRTPVTAKPQTSREWRDDDRQIW